MRLWRRSAYILIGANMTGKTTLQKDLLQFLCGQSLKRLRPGTRPVRPSITAHSRLFWAYFISRSFQEKEEWAKASDFLEDQYTEIDKADIAILSSHNSKNDAAELANLAEGLQRRGWNVTAVYWTNSPTQASNAITSIPWDDRLTLDNPINENGWKLQIEELAIEFGLQIIQHSMR